MSESAVQVSRSTKIKQLEKLLAAYKMTAKDKWSALGGEGIFCTLTKLLACLI